MLLWSTDIFMRSVIWDFCPIYEIMFGIVVFVLVGKRDKRSDWGLDMERREYWLIVVVLVVALMVTLVVVFMVVVVFIFSVGTSISTAIIN